MKASHLILSLLIVGCTGVAWFILGSTVQLRTAGSSRDMSAEVAGVWGPALVQEHPQAWFATPNAPDGRATVLPSKSAVDVRLDSEPKRRGLLWHRTYGVALVADYEFTNPTRIPQTLFVTFPLPADSAGLHGFEFRLGGGGEEAAVPAARDGQIRRAVEVPAGGTVPLHVAYQTRGTDGWRYRFPDASRIAGFGLAMRTNFTDISFPVGTGSPGARRPEGGGWLLEWDYPDVLAAPAIGMEMPKLLNAGPVAARIAFFAPVSLLFFVTVVLLVGGLKGVALHPMHVFFVAAGFFAFHLLFAYLVDLVPLHLAFAIAALASLVLVCGYLRAVGGRVLFRVAVPAQFAYLVLFSFSFFFDGLTGITIAVGAVVTLALLMVLTARVDWSGVFGRRPQPPPLGGRQAGAP